MIENPSIPSKTNGGPAYPDADDYGMSLLDWFAGQALAGVLADPGVRVGVFHSNVAGFCYDQAEAMLKERSARANRPPDGALKDI